VLTNVNANARVLTPEYLTKVAALAGVFRPYGIKVFLTARFSAPIEIGGLKTADPLDEGVRSWWKAKADEIYKVVPGLRRLSRESELRGTTRAAGLQAHARRRREHARRGCRATRWRSDVARVRLQQRSAGGSCEAGVRRVHAARRQFRDNVLVQVKNGRWISSRASHSSAVRRDAEHAAHDGVPDHQGVSRQDTHLVYLGRYFEEVLRRIPTRRARVDGREWSTVRCTVTRTGIAVCRTSGPTATGRLAVQSGKLVRVRSAGVGPVAVVAAIADEWIRMTFSNDAAVVARFAA
jgi:alpha-glucuronidase